MKKPAVIVNDTEALRYAGMLGHPYAVTCDQDADGNRRVLGECNDAHVARSWAADATRWQTEPAAYVTANGRAWRKTKSGYVAVRPKK